MRSFGNSLWVLGAAAGIVVAAAAHASSAGAAGPVVGRPVAPAVRAPQNPYLRYDAKCKSTGGVSASPCPITLTMSDPAQTVTVTVPASPPGTVTEKDNCTKGSTTIATVTSLGDNMYLVSSGSSTGKCRAIFKDKAGKTKIGKAKLPIVNQFAAP